ncbi:MAG: DNA-(apurinic or apyrimidinic site) lyase, partial [Acidobacteria bacterium]|nr:DNA-(apurinic or apyrimidinic site) lyase [Acidobacteriota bacterium]
PLPAMPEGDTIHRAAATLQRAMAGKKVAAFETVFPMLARVDDQTPIVGRTIEAVRAVGKNLLVDLSGDLHLRTHMRMNGSWHIYRPGEPWQKGRSEMRIVLATDDFVAVGFNIPVAEFLDGRALARHEDLRKIGPDLLGDFDEAEAKRRIRARRPDEEIANVLLNQRVVAGIGNEYKSEVLFVSRVSPFRRVAAVTDAELDLILENARTLMRMNVGPGSGGSRRTVRSLDKKQLLYVYGRGGDPCLTCGTKIEYRKQGDDARGTYWCPRCQG